MGKDGSNEWFSWIKIFIFALLFALIVRKFLFSPIIVDGPSMQPTLYTNDQMIVNKVSYYFKEPNRFDIIVFHASEQKDFIKRVIGLPGEHVMVMDNILYIDGEPIEQSFFNDNDANSIFTADFSLEQLVGGYETIPENHLLVLGDNRTNSTDSRHELGLVSFDQVVGKTNIIYWPPKRIQYIN